MASEKTEALYKHLFFSLLLANYFSTLLEAIVLFYTSI